MRQTLHLVTRRDYALIRAAFSETNHYDKMPIVQRVAPSLRAFAAKGHLTTAEAMSYLEHEHDLGRLAPGYLADVIAVPGDPSEDIKVTKDVCFVMKDGQIYKGA